MLQRVFTILFGVAATVLAQDINTYVPYHPKVDNSTYANVDQVIVTHQHIDWFADFTNYQMDGFILLDMTVISDTPIQFVTLDIWNQQMGTVQMCPPDTALIATNDAGMVPVNTNPALTTREVYNINQANAMGAFVIQLDREYVKGQQFSLQINFSTETGGNDGVFFLSPSQTAGGVQPMMFTNSQYTFGRMIAPQQDTPSNRITWGQCITAYQNLTSWCSGDMTGVYQTYAGMYKTCFYNKVPMPNFLMNTLVGEFDIQYVEPTLVEIAPAFIIAEPSIMNQAMAAFADLPQILTTVQDYVWNSGTMNIYPFSSFTLAVLPPVYPLKSLASPQLSYINQLMAYAPENLDDAQQEVVLVRIVAQMWCQALTSAVNWENQWVNDGIATALERWVISRLWTAMQAQTDAYVGMTAFGQQTNVIGLVNSTYYTLHPVLQGANPGYTYTLAPFELGFQFCDYINNLLANWEIGGGEYFLTYYLNTNFNSSINSYQFAKTFSNFVEGVGLSWKSVLNMQFSPGTVNQVLSMIEYDSWLYLEQNDPSGTLNFTNTDTEAAVALANYYLFGGALPSDNNYTAWYSSKQVVFHQTLLLNATSLDSTILTQIDQTYGITANTVDPEVLQRWYTAALITEYSAIYSNIQAWLSSMGIIKYLYNVYSACEYNVLTHNMCVGWFNENLSFYTPMAGAVVTAALNGAQPQ